MPNENMMMVRSAILVPILLLIAAIWMGCASSPWWLLAIPFVVVGWICAAPNLNFGNGMLAYLSMILGFILLNFHEPSGAAILAGAAAGFYLSALEMRITAKPCDPRDAPDTENESQTNKTALDNPKNASS